MIEGFEGIDASYYQNPKENPSDPGSKRLDIDWPAVAQAGKKFAIIRSGDGSFLDPCYEQNIRGAVAAGLHVEVYHFMRFALTPSAHATLLTRRLELAVSLGAAPRMWLDWEDTTEAANKLTITLRRGWAKGVMGGLSFPFGHYTGAWWWKPYMGDWDPGEPHWLATYGADEPALPPGWKTWLVWQYSSKGDVPGIKGYVDLNLAQDGFLKEEGMDDWHSRRWISGLLRQAAGHFEVAAGLADIAWSPAEYDDLKQSILLGNAHLQRAREVLRDNGLGPETGDTKIDTF